jgi:hypothetical protein
MSLGKFWHGMAQRTNSVLIEIQNSMIVGVSELDVVRAIARVLIKFELSPFPFLFSLRPPPCFSFSLTWTRTKG